MKRNISLFFAIVLIIIFSSCEKVIELNLNTTSTHIIIQGNIFDQTGPYTVKISKSVNFDEANEYPRSIWSCLLQLRIIKAIQKN